MKQEIPKPVLIAIFVALAVLVGAGLFVMFGQSATEGKVRADDYQAEPRDYWKGKLDQIK